MTEPEKMQAGHGARQPDDVWRVLSSRRALLAVCIGNCVMFLFGLATSVRYREALLPREVSRSVGHHGHATVYEQPVLQPDSTKRSERFPSKEQRLRLYLGDWQGECRKPIPYYRVNATSLVARETDWKFRRLELSSRPILDFMFWIDPPLLRECATNSSAVKEKAKLLRRYCNDSWDLSKSATPVLIQFGDRTGSKELGQVSLPQIRKVRQRLERYGECWKRDTPHEAIIWKLNAFRHYHHIFEVDAIDIPWNQKRGVAVFRGILTGEESENMPTDDYSVCMQWARCRLVYEHAGSKLVDAKLTGTRKRVNSTINGIEITARKLSAEQQMRNKAIVMLEGNDVSSGLKWALYSNSVVLMPHPTFTSWAMEELLQPYVHYIPLNDDLSNVESQVMWILAHDEEANRIAQRGKAWIRDLTVDPSARSDDEWIRKEIVRHYGTLFVESKDPL